MTEKEMLQKTIEAGSEMRAYQKSYFSEKDKDTKKYLLGKSKQAEKEFDNLLFNIKQLMK